MEQSLIEKTGKSLDHWLGVVAASGKVKHGEIVNFLKENHGFGHGFANFVGHKYNKSDADSADYDLVDSQYKGKENLFSIYEKLLDVITAFGEDISISPKKDSVSFIRKKQFALIKPASKTRVDLGLKLKNVSLSGRLEDSGPFGAMCTNRIQIVNLDDIDNETIQWIAEAYNQSV
jgi:predicted transport protein